MGFSYFNPNPEGKQVGDCTVRAIARATGQSWDATYIGLCLQGLIMGDMPSANSTCDFIAKLLVASNIVNRFAGFPSGNEFLRTKSGNTQTAAFSFFFVCF